MKDLDVIVSIIVPIYKMKVLYLEKCINSLMNQDMKNIEIILVDDGSEDDGSKYCDQVAQNDKRIKVIHQKNQGVSVARNNGIKLSRGKYIMFVDADDWIDEKMCSSLTKVAQENEVDIVCDSNSREFSNKTVRVTPYNINKNLIYDNKQEDFNPYDMRLLGSVWAKLYSREIINGELFDVNLSHGEDVEFNFRVFYKTKKILFVNKGFYHYRYSNSSTVRRFNKDIIKIYDKTIVKIKEDLDSKKVSEKHLSYQGFYSFVGIIYMVLCTNYVFNKHNNIKLSEKFQMLNKITTSIPFKEILPKINLKLLPITRRSLIFCGRYKIYSGIYFIVKFRELQCKIYNKEGR